MNSRAKIAITVAILLVIAAGLTVYLHRPPKPKPARIQETSPGREFVGVGLALRMDAQSSCPVIQQVVPNTPAAVAGITSDLMVSKVDGASLEGKTLSECVNLIRGPVGTIVRLELVTPDGSGTNTVELTRRKLKF